MGLVWPAEQDKISGRAATWLWMDVGEVAGQTLSVQKAISF